MQGEDRKERVAKGALPVTEEPKDGQPGRACSEGPVGRESQTRKVRSKREHHGPDRETSS